MNANLFRCCLVFLTAAMLSASQDLEVKISFEPLSGNARIHYQVPDGLPDIIEVQASYQLPGAEFLPAAVNKYRSATAMRIMPSHWIAEEQKRGTVQELLAAGRGRTLIWRTAGQLPAGEIVSGKIRITLRDPAQDKKQLAQGEAAFESDRSQIIMLNQFAGNPQIFPPLVAAGSRDNPGWLESPQGLQAVEKEDPLEPLCWRPCLKGYYAIYVYVPETGYGEIELRLGSDFFNQRFSALDGYEYFWKIAELDDRHLIIEQPYRTLFSINDRLTARLGYIKLVPATEQQYQQYARNRSGNRDKFVAGYFEPYSWAFREYVKHNSKFLEAMAAYREAMVDLVDAQCGRHGCKPLFPSSREMPMLHETKGDAAPGSHVQPTSLGTGRMVRNADVIRAGILAAKAFDLKIFSNFGAANNYRGGPLESDQSKNYPEQFIDRFYLNYADPQARQYALANHRQTLQRGARGISIDFCRYPHGLKNREDGNAFMRELRSLADEYSTADNRVEILARIPVPGCKNVKDQFDAETWIREKLIDYLVPADFGGMPDYDIVPFVKLVEGSSVKCLGGIDGGNGGPPFPGEVMRVADDYYRQGADGVYLYQSDAHIVGSMTAAMQIDHDLIRTLGHSKLLREALKQEENEELEYSFDVYFHFPAPYQSFRALYWIEGLRPDEVKMYIQDQLISSARQKPYRLGKMGFHNHYQFLGKDIKAKIELSTTGRIWSREFTIPMVLMSYSF